ncbi:hypothetical protein EYF80_057959 [Liparis tanakae]|uniref:Uncharacterized protein n=1 Tax=Liparis tanakae TaxID=230148 RepID=A0A4Z2ESW6_9TELE|nr:hypothetical protein EYF80_057959 [Liparis tanakae]
MSSRDGVLFSPGGALGVGVEAQFPVRSPPAGFFLSFARRTQVLIFKRLPDTRTLNIQKQKLQPGDPLTAHDKSVAAALVVSLHPPTVRHISERQSYNLGESVTGRLASFRGPPGGDPNKVMVAK